MASASASSTSAYDRSSTRLKSRDENSIRWVDLLEKFKSVQERTRSSQRSQQRPFDTDGHGSSSFNSHNTNTSLSAALSSGDQIRRDKTLPDTPRSPFGGVGGRASPGDGAGSGISGGKGGILGAGGTQKQKSGLTNLGRLRIGGGKSKR